MGDQDEDGEVGPQGAVQGWWDVGKARPPWGRQGGKFIINEFYHLLPTVAGRKQFVQHMGERRRSRMKKKSPGLLLSASRVPGHMVAGLGRKRPGQGW